VQPKLLDPQWARTARGRFIRLISFDPDEFGLHGLGGVYVIWHGGVRPEWVYVDQADDLAKALDAALDNPDIMGYEVNGGLMATWSPVVPEFRSGVVKYLLASLRPLIDHPAPPGDDVTPVPVYAPGTEPRNA
jgi:hypothetical protein